MIAPETKQSIICSNSTWVGQRLDKFLFSQFPEYSRAYFQYLIDQELVGVNQRPSKSSYALKLNDTIEITFKIKQYNLDPSPVDFEIIDQTDDFIIINKPAGLVVHPSGANPEEITLVNGLLYHFKEMNNFEEKERPGIVHRLDKNTSGLMIIARTQPALTKLSNMFKNRQISKTYLAVVAGTPLPSGSIDTPIGRNPVERHKMATFGMEERAALSHYEVLEQYPDCALLSVRIVTGRTHQIRVHCASIGHGIIGDAVYHTASPLIARQALHAWKISFEWLGKQHSYHCPVPDDFKELLKKTIIPKGSVA